MPQEPFKSLKILRFLFLNRYFVCVRVFLFVLWHNKHCIVLQPTTVCRYLCNVNAVTGSHSYIMLTIYISTSNWSSVKLKMNLTNTAQRWRFPFSFSFPFSFDTLAEILLRNQVNRNILIALAFILHENEHDIQTNILYIFLIKMKFLQNIQLLGLTWQKIMQEKKNINKRKKR